MTDAGKSIADWQRRFFAGPVVWTTVYEGVATHFYESEDAARVEVEWAKQKGLKGRNVPSVRKVHIHTQQLAEERWTP